MAIFNTDGQRPKVTVTTHKATPEELAEHRSYLERSESLQTMRPELIERYPDKWVALTENGALIIADSAQERTGKILELGERPGFAARDFLNTKPRPPMTL